MQKILYLSPHISTGGLPQYLYKKIQFLKNLYEIYVIIWDDIAPIYDVQRKNISKILDEEHFIILNTNTQHSIIEHINNIQPDIIHFEEIPEMWLYDRDICNKIYNPDRSYKIIETTHDSSFDVNNKLYLPDKFSFVSKWSMEQFKSLNIPMLLVEYPIEYKKRLNREYMLDLLSIDPIYLDPNKKHILNVGLWTSRKNQAEIIEYAKLLPEYEFHFIGNQADNFKWYWEPLMENLPKNCHIWGEQSNVDIFYNSMDLFLFTSLGHTNDRETNPLVLKEALSNNMHIFLYDLDVYMGSYDNNDNIHFLIRDDIEQNAQNIKNFLNSSEKNKYRLSFLDDCNNVNTTDGLKELCREHINKNDIIVEIGSFEGVSSELISRYCKTLHCIDPWETYTEIPDIYMKSAESKFDECIKTCPNIIKHKGLSINESEHFFNNSIDGVYIDGLHQYESVKNDIQHWLPKIKNGGFISGHDYTNLDGVRDAVHEFFDPKDIQVFSDSSWLVKIKKEKIVIFSHNYLINNWYDIVSDELNAINESELCNNITDAYFFAYAENINNYEQFGNLLSEKITSKYNYNIIILTENHFEFEALQSLKEYADIYNDSKILYFHTKGVVSENMENNNKYAIKFWRNELINFNIKNWKKCISLLDEYDTVGTYYFNGDNNLLPIYAGNFWWSNAKHISKLPLLNYFNEDRGNCENWLFKIPAKNYNEYTPEDKNLYLTLHNIYNVSKKEYQIQQDQDEWNIFLNSILASDSKLQHKNILEIGVYDCGTPYTFCQFFDNVLSIDINKHTNVDKLQSQQSNWTFLHENSHAVNLDTNIKFDMIFIDGDHTYNGIKHDYEKFLPYINDYGYIIFHDIKNTDFHHQHDCFVDQFWNELKNNNKNNNFEFIEIKNHNVDFGGLGVLKINKQIQPNNTDEVFIVSAHPDTEKSREITKKCIESLTKTGRNVILTSHIPTMIELNPTGTTIIDPNNPLIEHDFYKTSWYNTNEFFAEINITKNNNNLNHAPACSNNYYNGIKYAKADGYKYAICINFDLIISEQDYHIFDEICQHLKHNNELAYFMTKQEQEGPTAKTIFFITNIDYFLSKFKYFENTDKYKEFINTYNAETNCLENVYWNVIKNDINNLYLEETNEESIFPNSEINLFSMVEYFTYLPIKNDNTKFMIWFSTSNFVDDRTYKIEIFDDKNILLAETSGNIKTRNMIYVTVNIVNHVQQYTACLKIYDSLTNLVKEKTIHLDKNILSNLSQFGVFEWK